VSPNSISAAKIYSNINGHGSLSSSEEVFELDYDIKKYWQEKPHFCCLSKLALML
ncbi:11350_t:CDS:1, partial [Gigaspora margarita]